MGHVEAQELSLQDAIAKALENNPSMKSAEAQVRIAEGRKLQALSPAPLSIGFHEEDIASGDGIGNGGQRIYSISQDFDIPLLLGSRGYLYGALRDAAKIQLQYRKRQIAGEAVSAYALLFAREEQHILARRNATLAEQFADAARRRYEAGATTRLEFLQARSRLAVAQRTLRDAEAAMRTASSSLISIIGDTAMVAVSTGDSLHAQREIPSPPVDVLSFTDNHPIVRMAYLEYEGYRSDRNWRWMEYLPSFSASAFRQEYQGMGNFWGVELTAHVPVWLLLAPRGSNREASGYALEAEAQYTAARIRAKAVLARTYENLAAARENLNSYTGALLDEAREMQRTADASFAAGEISSIEYFSAMETANQLLNGYFDTLAEYYRAESSYYVETGMEIQW